MSYKTLHLILMMSGTARSTEVNPYPNKCLFLLDIICLWMLRLFRIPLDSFLSSFGPTTVERKRLNIWIIKKIMYTPFLLIAMLLTFPVAALGGLVWLTFQHRKTPYRISISLHDTYVPNYPEKLNSSCFATMNMCLLQQCLSRFNNQTDPLGRSKKQGQRIAQQQLRAYCNISTNNNKPHMAKALKGNMHNGVPLEEFRGHAVLEEFPLLDILLIQETWIKEYAESLTHELHNVFPYIVYDAGYNSWSTNCFLGNSGLMIASRYPVIDVRFDAFKSKGSQCRLACKGLLQIKVLVKKTTSYRYVGYAYSTHLQAYQGTRPIHTDQLNDVYEWTTRFRKTTLQPNEVVVFDILGGDFNLDNSSPVDRMDWSHALFDIYRDLGRVGPGVDQPWAVGTEMRHTPLHDPLIQTPAGLKLALEDPLLLQYFVLDGTIADLKYEVAWEMPQLDSNGKQMWHRLAGRRRIDYVMQRASDTHIKSVSLQAVAQLAGLTDHIPYCLTIKVPEFNNIKPEDVPSVTP